MSIKVTASTLVERNGEYLLVREGTDPKGRFNLPGGGAKKRETWPQAAVRETGEETGLDVEIDYLIGVYQSPRTEARNNLTRFVFKVTEVGGDIQVCEHHPEVDLFPYKVAERMHESGQLSNLAVILAIRDYRAGKGVLPTIITELPKVKRKLLIPKDEIDLENGNIES